jgi:hypothetical protein
MRFETPAPLAARHFSYVAAQCDRVVETARTAQQTT